ncbi:hypothetical protein THAOC_19243, partial [Thalassiosira oceanica]
IIAITLIRGAHPLKPQSAFWSIWMELLSMTAQFQHQKNLFVPGIWMDDIALCSDESKVVMCANGDDGLYIDRIEMWHDGTKRKSWGTEDDSGWCLSTESSDTFGGACANSYQCAMLSMSATENEIDVERPLIEDDHQPTFPLNSTYKPWLIGTQGEKSNNLIQLCSDLN